MRAVWKYPLPLTSAPSYVCQMPIGAEILHVAAQDDTPTLWALVDPDADVEGRAFRIVGTGHAEVRDRYVHRGSVVTHGGAYVWHVFEVDLGPDHEAAS